MSRQEVLAAERVSVCLGGNNVLDDVSAEVLPGQVTVLVGPNGAGKSTLLRVLCGDEHPDAGQVSLNGVPLDRLDIGDQARLRSVMSQSSVVAFDFLVDDILGMGWVQSSHASAADFRAALAGIAVDCGISHLRGRRFNTLSGGEQQRVHFARALLQVRPGENPEPRYLLLDEPTSSLDLAHELQVLRLSRRAAQQGLGVLVVLHNLNLAARFADRVILMASGRTVAIGSVGEILDSGQLSAIYETPVHVEWHAKLERLIVYS